MNIVFLAVEDDLSASVAHRLLRRACGASCVPQRLGGGRAPGSGQIRKNLSQYIDLASRQPVAVITDLDDRKCPVTLISDWFGSRKPPSGMAFRIAVRETEAWLMADREGFAEFLGVSDSVILRRADDVQYPKQTLVSIARKARKELRSEIVPSRGSKAIQGLGYNDVLSAFTRDKWDAERASAYSDSLRRAIAGFEKLRDYWGATQ